MLVPIRWKAICSALPLVFLAASAALAIDGPVTLKAGQVTGVALEQGVQIYRGIPYAAPPVGDLRWRPPQPVGKWEGVRACDKFGPTALQGQGIGVATGPSGEDCLYLNVWTPAKAASEKLPVMVWIHGGGWTGGSGSSATYHCESFARKGVVAVTINYRLGALGFFSHPALSKESERGVSGNYGLLDTIAALEWVRDNIAGFGGDPGNVTIFGESAGGGTVYLLVASPLAKGLFHKAIAESAWITDTNVVRLKEKTGFSDSAEAMGAKSAGEVLKDNPAEVLAALRALPAREALTLNPKAVAVVDGWLLPRHPAEIYAQGKQNRVPVIAGTNNGEGMMFAARGGSFNSVEAFREARGKEFGDSADELLKFYGAASTDGIRKATIDFMSDDWFIRATREMTRGMARLPEPTYMYHFTRNRTNPAEMASHAAELPYVFMRLGSTASAADQKLSDTINSYWVQFAKTGNPNGPGLPNWPAFDEKAEQHLELDVEPKVGTFLRKDQLDALDRYVEKKNKEATK